MRIDSLQRVNIVGCSGSGKTTLGRNLAQKLGVRFVDLDDFIWLPDWKTREESEFKTLVRGVLETENWVVSGNYSRLRHEIWARAQTVIWLDYALPVVMKQMLWRTFGRNLRGNLCCNGNRETWRRTFSRDSIVLYAWKTHAKRRREYPAIMGRPDAAHLQVFRFETPSQTREWLARI